MVLAVTVKAGRLARLDHSVAAWAQSLRSQPLDQLAAAASFFGSSPWTACCVAALSVWWLRRGARPRWRAFLAGGALGLVLQVVLRFAAAQWRPDTEAAPASADLFMRYELAGFTSGHAFRASYLYGWGIPELWRRGTAASRAAAIGCAVLILMVCATRVYLNRHWLSDVTGGFLLAMAMRGIMVGRK